MTAPTDKLVRAAAELLLEAMPGDEFEAAERMLLEILSRRLIERNTKAISAMRSK